MSALVRYEARKAPARRPTEQQLRQEIIQICRLLHSGGYCLGYDGNVSARLDGERFLVTPSGVGKAFVRADQLVIVDGEGNLAGQGRYGPQRGLKPSSEILLHLEAYRQRPDVQAVIHAHPPIAIALSIAGISLARCLLPDIILYFGLIPTTEYATPASAEGVAVISELIKTLRRADPAAPRQRHRRADRQRRLPQAGEAGAHRADHQDRRRVWAANSPSPRRRSPSWCSGAATWA